MTPRSARDPRLLVMILVGALIGVGVVVLLPDDGERPERSSVGSPAVVRPEQEAARMLRLWDGARARAWSTGDAAGLRALYVPGSTAGAADVALLGRWRARGLRVFGMEMQVVRLDVLAHSSDRWRLRVTERLAAADVVGPGMEAELIDPEMPPGATRTRELELREADGTWRMALVRALS